MPTAHIDTVHVTKYLEGMLSSASDHRITHLQLGRPDWVEKFLSMVAAEIYGTE